MTRRLVAASAVLAAAATAVWMMGFAGDDESPQPVEAVGIVVDVDGGLTDVTAFRIRTAEGV